MQPKTKEALPAGSTVITAIVLVLELRIGMNENDHHSYLSLVISSSEKGQKNSDLNGDSNLDLCDAGAVLFELSYQAN